MKIELEYIMRRSMYMASNLLQHLQLLRCLQKFISIPKSHLIAGKDSQVNHEKIDSKKHSVKNNIYSEFTCK